MPYRQSRSATGRGPGDFSGHRQRLDQRPQVIVHGPRPSTHIITNGRIDAPVTPDQDISPRSCYVLSVS